MTESICNIPHGSEAVAAILLGGKFDIEDCGFFTKCTNRIEKFDYSSTPPLYAELWYCAIDWIKVIATCIITIILVVVLMKFIKYKLKNNNNNNENNIESKSKL
jgi:hypothetical protein